MAKFVDPEDTTLDGILEMNDNMQFNCTYCVHKLQNKGVRETCVAFPDGIPTPISLGEVVHNKPMFLQKNSIVFKGK